MTRKLVLMLLLTGLLLAGCQTTPGSNAGRWQSLFDGKSFDGWKASENKDTFSVRDGMIVAHGPRSHLFYTGPVNNANFKNFEFKADVMTTEGSNSGIYFHTEYQEKGWPSKGFECQVNSTQTDINMRKEHGRFPLLRLKPRSFQRLNSVRFLVNFASSPQTNANR